MLFLLIAACTGEHGPHGDAPHEHDGAPHAHDGAPVDHAATPHAHAAAHGGEVKQVGGLHIEARFVKSGVMAWVRNAAEAPVDPTGIVAGAVVKADGEVQNVPMAAMGDHLHAAVALTEGAPADAVLTLTVDGAPVSVDFRTAKVGALAEHDHTSLHGGVVSMWGDTHVEYLARGGEIRFWVSDAHRAAVTDGVQGVARVDATEVPLRFDAATGALVGAATPAPGQKVSLEATIGGNAFTLAF